MARLPPPALAATAAGNLIRSTIGARAQSSSNKRRTPVSTISRVRANSINPTPARPTRLQRSPRHPQLRHRIIRNPVGGRLAVNSHHIHHSIPDGQFKKRPICLPILTLPPESTRHPLVRQVRRHRHRQHHPLHHHRRRRLPRHHQRKLAQRPQNPLHFPFPQAQARIHPQSPILQLVPPVFFCFSVQQ